MQNKVKKILYILDIFPATSETFVINEILEAQNQGVDIDIFSRKYSEEGDVHKLTGGLKGGVTYWAEPAEISLPKIILAHFKLLLLRFTFYIKTFVHALSNNKDGYFYHFKIAGFYASQILDKKYDHLHAHFVSHAAITTMFMARILNIPYTVTGHGWHDVYENVIPFFKRVSESAGKLITISEYNRDFIIKEHCVSPEKIEIVHCGINLDLFSNQAKVNQPLRILSVARLHPIKGVKYLIEACAILKQKKIDFECLIIGEGEERKDLEVLMKNHQLENNVHLLGAKAADQVREYYATSDIYVLSSLCEGLPVVVMEAMASSLPVVATHVTGIAELIEDGVNGFLVPIKDVDLLAERIQILIEDEQKRLEFANRNREKVSQLCDLKKEVTKLIHIWIAK